MNKNNKGLFYAYYAMINLKNAHYKRNFKISSKQFEIIKSNIKFDDEHKHKIKIKHADFSGNKNPFYKKRHTKETKDKIRKPWIKRKDIPITIETKLKHSLQSSNRKWYFNNKNECIFTREEVDLNIWKPGRKLK